MLEVEVAPYRNAGLELAHSGQLHLAPEKRSIAAGFNPETYTLCTGLRNGTDQQGQAQQNPRRNK